MNPASTQENSSPRMGQYIALVIGRRWWAISFAVAFWAIALASSLLLPTKFRSETLILVEQQKVLPQYVAPNVTNDLQERMQSLTQQLLSRTRLIRIMDTFHLYGKQIDQPATDDMIQRMRNDITVDVSKSSGHADQLTAFKVSYSAPTAALAQSVAGQLTSLFINENLQGQQQRSEDTTAFLDNQLAAADEELHHQEQRLGELRRKYMGELPEQLTSNVQILTGLQNRLQSDTGALHQAEQQGLYLASLIGQYKNPPQANAKAEEANVPSSLDDQIEKMQVELADLTARYTPQHPDVVRLREQIAKAESLKRQQDAEAKPEAKPSAAAGSRPRSGNQEAISPIAQLESQLKANELEIANRKQGVKTLEAEIEQYQARLNLTPMREQQLADAGRDHEESQKNYNSLLEKKKQSQMVEDITKRQQDAQFSVIDPPSLPQRPYWPNPLQFSLAGLAGGLAVGIALIIIKEAANPLVRMEEDLRQWTGIKVIGLIPPLVTPAEERNRSRLRGFEILAGSVAVVLIPLVTMIVYAKHYHV